MSKELIDLTLPECLSKKRSSLKPNEIETVVIVDDCSPEVTFVPPEAYSPARKKRLAIQSKILTYDDKKLSSSEDLQVTYFQAGIQLPHAREHCTEKKFLMGFEDNSADAVDTNKAICEQCYCFICEVNASECKSWSTGLKPHCNSFAKNVVWGSMKRNIRIDSDFIFNSFSEEDKEFGVNPSCPDPTTWTKLLDMKSFFCDYNAEKAAVIPCFCHCHDQIGSSTCGDCERDRCARPIRFVGFRDLVKLLHDFLQLHKEKLSTNLDGVAAILLDGFTAIIMLPATKTEYVLLSNKTEMRSIIERLRKEWIDLFLSSNLSEKATDKLRERLRNLIIKIKFPEFRLILQGAVDILPWKVVNTAIESPTLTTIKQTVVEAEARVAYYRKKKLWQNIINYGKSATIIDASRNMPANSIFYIRSIRLFLSHILAKLGKPVESVILSHVLYFVVLPEKVMNSICGKQTKLTLTDLKHITIRAGSSHGSCPLLDYSENQFKNLLSLLRGENVDIFENAKIKYSFVNTPSPETLQLMLIVTIRGLVMNRQLHHPNLLQWLFKALCTTNSTISTKENGEKNFSRKNTNLVIELIKKAKRDTVNANDLNIGIPHQALIIQVLVVVAVERVKPRQTAWLNEFFAALSGGTVNEAYLTLAYACEQFHIVPPSEVVERMVDTSLPIFGVTILSVDVYRSWFYSKEISNSILLKLWRTLLLNTKLEASSSKHDREMRKTIRDDLGKFVKKLIDNIVKDPLNHEKTDIRDLEILCKTSQVTWPYPMRDFHTARLEMEFKLNPTSDKYKALNAGLRGSPGEWDRCKQRCCEYVRLHCRSIGVEKCLYIFYHLESFKEMKDFVTNLKMNDRSCEQVSQICKDSCKRFIQGFHPWVARQLVNDFIAHRISRISYKALELLDKANSFDPRSTVFTCVLWHSIYLFEQHLNNATCTGVTRNSALEWLVQLKTLCIQWGKLEDFSSLYHKLLNGILKRKKMLITTIAKCDTGDIMSPKVSQCI